MTAACRAGILPIVHRELPAWIVYLGRFGQLAKGLFFVCVGLLPAEAAWRGAHGANDSRGAIRAIAQHPFGRALLLALIVGLACHILWRILAAFADVERKGTAAQGLMLRARSLAVAGIYGGLAFVAVKTFMGISSAGGDRSARDWTARAMETPFGSWLVVLAGAGIICGGLYQCYGAYKGEFKKKLQLSELGDRARPWILRVCAFGLIAQGVVFTIAGVFLIQAGWQSNPQKARGLGGALNALQAQPHGRWLFATVAAGLTAYGIYCCLRARYGKWGER